METAGRCGPDPVGDWRSFGTNTDHAKVRAMRLAKADKARVLEVATG